VTFGVEPQQSGVQHLRRYMVELQEGGVEPQRWQRHKKTLQRRKPPWMSAKSWTEIRPNFFIKDLMSSF